MTLRNGSHGWLTAVYTLSYLENQANVIRSILQGHLDQPLSDEEFAVILATAIDHGGFNPVNTELPEGITVTNFLFDWRHGKDLPTALVREKMLEWVADRLEEKVSEIKAFVGPLR